MKQGRNVYFMSSSTRQVSKFGVNAPGHTSYYNPNPEKLCYLSNYSTSRYPNIGLDIAGGGKLDLPYREIVAAIWVTEALQFVWSGNRGSLGMLSKKPHGPKYSRSHKVSAHLEV